MAESKNILPKTYLYFASIICTYIFVYYNTKPLNHTSYHEAGFYKFKALLYIQDAKAAVKILLYYNMYWFSNYGT